MIIEKQDHTWRSGKGHNVLHKGYRYLVQCDNPDCNKQFFRQEKEINGKHKAGAKNQYCKAKCHATHHVGTCSMEDCNEPITNAQKQRGHDNGLCRKHSIREQSRKNAIKYRQRDKGKVYKLLGSVCVNCGEADPMFLEIDHVANDGRQHREQVNYKWGADHKRATSMHPRHYLKYLQDNPEGLQILCANCNKAKERNGGVLYMRPAVAA